jgi:hypothetical protein
LCQQSLVSREVELRIAQQRLVLDELTLGLCQGRFVRARIDLRQQIPLLDHLTFLESDRGQIAADAGFQSDGGQRCHRTQGLHLEGQIALLYHVDGH